MSDHIYLSREGRLKMEGELKRLKFEERPRILAEIKRAMELGDLSENAEYHSAKEAQRLLELRISEIEDKLSRVRSIDVEKIPTDKAYLFSKVLVKDLRDGEEILYTLAPADEVDIDNNVISIKSPIGAALLGKGIGEVVQIKVPAGEIRYEVIKIGRE
jgi:transcription elongation factor GreA